MLLFVSVPIEEETGFMEIKVEQIVKRFLLIDLEGFVEVMRVAFCGGKRTLLTIVIAIKSYLCIFLIIGKFSEGFISTKKYFPLTDSGHTGNS